MAAKESELAGGEVSCLFSTRAEFDFISLLFTFCIQKPLAFFFFLTGRGPSVMREMKIVVSSFARC